MEKEEGAAKREDRECLGSTHSQSGAPETVMPAPRLRSDINALMVLTEPTEPLLRLVWSNKVFVALHSGGDASGSGFGGAIMTSEGTHVRHGIWTYDVQQESLNFQELNNLVTHVEETAAQGHLRLVEMFLYTDNSTAEAAYYNGASSDKELDELVVQLKKVVATEAMRLHLLHITRTRMIELGIDGLTEATSWKGSCETPSYYPQFRFTWEPLTGLKTTCFCNGSETGWESMSLSSRCNRSNGLLKDKD